jgi:hypothetical protein
MIYSGCLNGKETGEGSLDDGELKVRHGEQLTRLTITGAAAVHSSFIRFQ